ncbi:MAG: beta-1,6-N-acetylglucosaminyltransferase [Halobacteriota archaeon]
MSINIAYIISAYKYPDQLIRLITRLNNEGSYFFVHVDKKTDDTIYDKMLKGVSHYPNVFFLKRHICYWGDFGHVLATIKGLNDALDRNIDFDYFFLLTGQDYPIKSNFYIEELLRKNSGNQFIKYVPIPCDPEYGWDKERGGLDRIETWSFRFCNKFFRFPDYNRQLDSKIKSFILKILVKLIPKRKFPKNLKPFGGSSYWCITKECAEYISDFIKKNPAFVRYFKYVYIPDEIFFQTIILNSPFKECVINDDLRCIDWSCPGRGGSLPRIWCEEDITVLSQSNGLIARKFDSTIDSEVFNLIDSKLLSNL